MRHLVMVVAAISISACAHDVVAPRAGVTLLVTNASCLSGSCESVRVLAYPADQPDTPGGYWSLDLGVVTTAQKCFVLPSSAHFYVIAEPATSSRDTTTFTWTTLVPLSLGLSTNGPAPVPSTRAFIPANAAGWSITLPTDSAAAPGQACTP